MLTITDDYCGAPTKQSAHSFIEPMFDTSYVAGPVPGSDFTALKTRTVSIVSGTCIPVETTDNKQTNEIITDCVKVL